MEPDNDAFKNLIECNSSCRNQNFVIKQECNADINDIYLEPPLFYQEQVIKNEVDHDNLETFANDKNKDKFNQISDIKEETVELNFENEYDVLFDSNSSCDQWATDVTGSSGKMFELKLIQTDMTKSEGSYNDNDIETLDPDYKHLNNITDLQDCRSNVKQEEKDLNFNLEMVHHEYTIKDNDLSNKHNKSKKCKSEVYNYCQFCEFKTTNALNLQLHINGKHTMENLFNCDECNYKTARLSDLKMHTKATHTKQSFLKCDYCEYKTARVGHLNRHVNAKHIKHNLHKCDFCNYKSIEVGNLKRHIESKHIKENMHKCQYCSYENVRISEVKMHESSKHTKQNAHKCDYCKYETPRMQSLRRHLNSKHMNGNEVFHKCKYCKYKTSRLDTLKAHVNIMHKLHKNSIRTDKKIQKCNFCEYQTRSVSHLKRHIGSKH